MKRFIFFAVLLALTTFLVSPLLAYKINDNAYLKWKEEFRIETWSTFEKPTTKKDSYTFASSKMRLGFGFTSKLIDAYGSFNWTQFFGLPRTASYGTGALYFGQNNGSGNVGQVGITQAWIRARFPGFESLSATIGRFKYNSGLEYKTLPKNKRLAWLRKLRISQRLIGGFEWSRVGRSYDGFQVAYDDKAFNITVAGMQPTPGGFYLDIMDDTYNGYKSHDIDLLTVVATLKDTVIKGLDAQFFYYYYNDERDVSVGGIVQNPEISNFGGHILYVTPKVWLGSFDFLLWGDAQTGSWGSADQSAFAIAVEGGYKFEDVAWQPWLRTGFFRSSGDDDPTDNDRNTFFMMTPTLRIYAMTPWYNLMNTKYWFFQVIAKPMCNLVVRSDFTKLWLTEEDDAWYQGSGMTRPDIFGYKGLKGHIGQGHDSLGSMWDISLFFKNIYKYNGLALGMDLYYSHVWGDDVVEDNFQKDDDLDFFYVEFRLTF